MLCGAIFNVVATAAIVSSAQDLGEPAPTPKVEAVVPVCEPGPYDRDRLLALLGVELKTLGIEVVQARAEMRTPEEPLPSNLLATIVVRATACDENVDSVVLQILDHASRKTVERYMTVGDVDREARPRAMALAVVELLGASWAELMMGPSQTSAGELPERVQRPLATRLLTAPALAEADSKALGELPAAAAHGPTHEAEGNQEPLTVVERFRLDARGTLWGLPSRGTTLLGGQLAVSFEPLRELQLFVAGDATFGDTRVARGTVGMSWFAGMLGADFVTDHGVQLGVGPRVQLGFARGRGDSDLPNVTERTQSAATFALLIGANLRARLAGSVAASVGFDIGQVIAGVDFLADDQRASGIGGAVASLRVGISMSM